MADDSQQDASPPADAGRGRRPPPTIDLEATDVTTAPAAEAGEPPSEPGTSQNHEAPESHETRSDTAAEPRAAEQTATDEPAPAAADTPRPPPRRSGVSPWVIAPFSGAVAAALVIGVGWMLGWPAVQNPPAAPEVSTTAFEALGKRVTAIEGRLDKADATLSAMTPAALAAPLRAEIASVRAQQDKLSAALNDLKAAPRDAAAPAAPVDISGISDRLAKLEQALSAQAAAIARADEAAADAKANAREADAKAADAKADAKAADVKPADDLPLRRVVAATLLDVAVRHGDPFKSTLAAAKALDPSPDELDPLGQFAASGLPSPQMLGRELLNLVPKLPQGAPGAPSSGGGILDRLQARAEKLVQVERTDVTGNDRGAIVARATAAALRNDIADARRELESLPPADRGPAQGWLDKVAARDAALSAARQFADSAMAALGNPGQ